MCKVACHLQLVFTASRGTGTAQWDLDEMSTHSSVTLNSMLTLYFLGLQKLGCALLACSHSCCEKTVICRILQATLFLFPSSDSQFWEWHCKQSPVLGYHQLQVDEESWCEERKLSLVGWCQTVADCWQRVLLLGLQLFWISGDLLAVKQHSVFIAIFDQSDKSLRSPVTWFWWVHV